MRAGHIFKLNMAPAEFIGRFRSQLGRQLGGTKFFVDWRGFSEASAAYKALPLLTISPGRPARPSDWF